MSPYRLAAQPEEPRPRERFDRWTIATRAITLTLCLVVSGASGALAYALAWTPSGPIELGPAAIARLRTPPPKSEPSVGFTPDGKLVVMTDVAPAPNGPRIWIEPVRFASVDDLADHLTEIFSYEQNPPRFVADHKANALVIIADEPTYRRVLGLLRQEDSPTGIPEVHLVALEHARAKPMSKMLEAIVSGAAHENPIFEGKVQIIPDETTNALVIKSSHRDFVAISWFVKKLDTK